MLICAFTYSICAVQTDFSIVRVHVCNGFRKLPERLRNLRVSFCDFVISHVGFIVKNVYICSTRYLVKPP